jgi:hypothetical protein
MRYQGKLGSEYPPLTSKGEVTAGHICERDVLTPAHLAHMLLQTGTQCALALGGVLRYLADVNQFLFEIQGVNAAFGWPDTLG